MATSKNKFSVKATIYPNKREKSVDGPWKPTVEEAAQAFAEMLVKQGFRTQLVSRAFVAERCDEATAPAKDNRGNCYKSVDAESQKLIKLLEAQAVRLHSISVAQ